MRGKSLTDASDKHGYLPEESLVIWFEKQDEEIVYLFHCSSGLKYLYSMLPCARLVGYFWVRCTNLRGHVGLLVVNLAIGTDVAESFLWNSNYYYYY
jgi:hypothetical protein